MVDFPHGILDNLLRNNIFYNKVSICMKNSFCSLLVDLRRVVSVKMKLIMKLESREGEYRNSRFVIKDEEPRGVITSVTNPLAIFMSEVPIFSA